ncbi:MAG: H-NS histone family protein, partial [Burkholderiales bacterium]|nr:H-NS histone family protein [Burkholderiales bacterium]
RCAKYRNNTTGETWSGRGKPPKWMAGHDKSQYLIK